MKIKLTQSGNYEWCWRLGHKCTDKRGNEFIVYGSRSKFFPSREAALADAKSKHELASYARRMSVVLKEEEIEIE